MPGEVLSGRGLARRRPGCVRHVSVSRPLESTEIRGYLNRSFLGVKWWESEEGPEGKEGGKIRGKGWEERGPKVHSKKSDLVPL